MAKRRRGSVCAETYVPVMGRYASGSGLSDPRNRPRAIDRAPHPRAHACAPQPISRPSIPRVFIAGLLIMAFCCISYASFTSIGSLASAIAEGNVGLSDEAKSTPKSDWKRGVVPVLYQIDSAWEGVTYGEEALGVSGCGPTCLSMVYVALTGKTDLDPPAMARYSEEGGYLVDGKTSWDLMTMGAADLGLRSEELPADEGIVKSRLAVGRPVIASVGPGTFTTSGHFIVLCGLDKEGNVVIHDPNSVERTKKVWELGEIMPQFRNIWAFSK